MKAVRIGALAVGAAALLASASAPAQAASYTIYGTSVIVSSTHQSFVKVGCDPSKIANGADAVVINISGRQNQFATFSWDSPAKSPYSRLNVFFYNGGCGAVPINDSAITGPSKTFFVPAGTQWAVVESYFTPNVTLNV